MFPFVWKAWVSAARAGHAAVKFAAIADRRGYVHAARVNVVPPPPPARGAARGGGGGGWCGVGGVWF
jgi:hypothetical protein